MGKIKEAYARAKELRDKGKVGGLTASEKEEFEGLRTGFVEDMVDHLDRDETPTRAKGVNEEPKIRSVFQKEKDEPKYLLADIFRSAKLGGQAEGLSKEVKNMTSTTGAAVIQDPVILSQIVTELQSYNPLVEAGVVFKMIQNYSSMPKVTQGPSWHWQSAEGEEIPVSTGLTISSVDWSLKDLSIRVRCSNQFLMDSEGLGRAVVQSEITRQINFALIQAVLLGTGVSGEPQGLENMTGLQTLDINPDAGLSDWSEIIEACRLLAAVNVPISNISAFGSPTVWSQMASFADSTGQPLRKPALLEPVRFFDPTTLVPETYDTSTTTKLFLGDFSKLVVGFQGPFQVVIDQNRAHHLETEFLTHLRIDVRALYEEVFVEVTGILI